MPDLSSGASNVPLKFRWPWRPYQQRVLDALESHLADRKLHVVAAPGAGKTVLGLEIFRRLGQPALALSPTRGIRDQWVARLRDFTPEGSSWPPEWAGTSLGRIGLFTSVTYQALHAKYRDSEKGEDENGACEQTDEDAPPTDRDLDVLLRSLRGAGVRLVILDEAHHLRAEWWKALKRILDDLPEAVLLSLTATPPYDVTGAEWSHYEALCGPIDEEISVPELVKAGTLCPHQDYVWMVEAPDSDRKAVADYDAMVLLTCSELAADPEFLKAVETHPWVAGNTPEPAAILESPETAFALLVFLKRCGRALPAPLMKALATGPDEVPAESRRWWEALIRAYLFDGTWPADEAGGKHRETLARRLRSRQLLWRKELRLVESRAIRSRLSMSPAKIDACIRIHREESARRGTALREVVLTDYIGDEEHDGTAAGECRRLAAVPVFRALSEATAPEDRPYLALLTGRVAMIHGVLEGELRAAAGDACPMPADAAIPGFRRYSADSAALLPAFTALLNAGRIRCLVGTRSLLGEGWDAPAINVLTLASFVGSFMLTNQMRGRAIRVCRADPDKAASIWHIAAVARGAESGLSDLEDLRRRFGTFVGLDASEPAIESGLRRLRLGCFDGEAISAGSATVADNNAEMTRRLADAGNLRARWQAAIERGGEGRVAPGVSVQENESKLRSFVFRHTLRQVLLQALYAFLGAFGWVAQHGQNARGKVALWLLAVAAAAGFCVSLPKFIRALILWARHLPVDGALRQIALAARDALCASDQIQTNPRRLEVKTVRLPEGAWSITLAGATFFEQSLFADTVEEMLGPIDNPRYLLTRGEWRGWNRRVDYHAVPVVLGVKKEWAQVLHAAWQRRLGPSELIYTRTPENRAVLLRARARAFSAAFTSQAQRLDRWQ